MPGSVLIANKRSGRTKFKELDFFPPSPLILHARGSRDAMGGVNHRFRGTQASESPRGAHSGGPGGGLGSQGTGRARPPPGLSGGSGRAGEVLQGSVVRGQPVSASAPCPSFSPRPPRKDANDEI